MSDPIGYDFGGSDFPQDEPKWRREGGGAVEVTWKQQLDRVMGIMPHQHCETCNLLVAELHKLAELLRRLEHGQGAQPCCPKCGRDCYIEGTWPHGRVVVECTKGHRFDLRTLLSFAQFFAADGAQGSGGLVWKSAEERGPFASNASPEPAGRADEGEGQQSESERLHLESVIDQTLAGVCKAKTEQDARDFLRKTLLIVAEEASKPADLAQGQPLDWVKVLKSVISGTYACHYQQNTFPGESEPCGQCAHCRADKILGEGWKKGSGSAQPQMSAREFAERLRANCHANYNGGYKDEREREIFHHGMDTVCNALAKGALEAFTRSQGGERNG